MPSAFFSIAAPASASASSRAALDASGIVGGGRLRRGPVRFGAASGALRTAGPRDAFVTGVSLPPAPAGRARRSGALPSACDAWIRGFALFELFALFVAGLAGALRAFTGRFAVFFAFGV